MFVFLRALISRDWEGGIASLDSTADGSGEAWTSDRLSSAMTEYRKTHEHLLLGPEARNLRHTYVKAAEDGRRWRVQQMLVDPQGLDDWVAEFEVDLTQSRERQEPMLRLMRLGPLV
jgi:hypothetical protein